MTQHIAPRPNSDGAACPPMPADGIMWERRGGLRHVQEMTREYVRYGHTGNVTFLGLVLASWPAIARRCALHPRRRDAFWDSHARFSPSRRDSLLPSHARSCTTMPMRVCASEWVTEKLGFAPAASTIMLQPVAIPGRGIRAKLAAAEHLIHAPQDVRRRATLCMELVRD